MLSEIEQWEVTISNPLLQSFFFFMSKRSLSMGNEFLMYWAYPFPIYINSFRTSLSGAVYAWRKGALEWS